MTSVLYFYSNAETVIYKLNITFLSVNMLKKIIRSPQLTSVSAPTAAS